MAGYGPIPVLHGISLRVEEGEAVALVGANGAGKTTALRAISGLLRPSRGRITFGGRPIHLLPPHRIAALGLTHVPEGRGIFGRLTVQENLELGAYPRGRGRREDLELVFHLFPVLEERFLLPAASLSGGEQQMLAIGRALMARPRLMLLDEPSLGLSPLMVQRVYRALGEIAARGTALLLVEQNLSLALSFARRAYVLEGGRVALSGPAGELLASADVRRAYLGDIS